MAEEVTQPEETEGPDFGTFLGRRLRGYQAGVLGIGSLNEVPLSADGPGRAIIGRSAEFSSSLQSLLSYRTVQAERTRRTGVCASSGARLIARIRIQRRTIRTGSASRSTCRPAGVRFA